ncbi:MAG: YicC family protein [Proteobacteria bacterium]|nr:YicC family protein [Pseudomonadota bacterium]
MNAAAVKVSVKSMTGFARVSFGAETLEIDIEVKSVNQRYLEIIFKAPRHYSAIERDVKAIFQQQHRRGRIEISVTRRSKDVGNGSGIEFSLPFDSAVKRYSAACKRYGAHGDSLADFIGELVLRDGMAGEDSDLLSQDETFNLLRIISEASEALVVMRETEGLGLVSDIVQRLSTIESLRSEIGVIMEGAPTRIKERMEERLKVVASDLRLDPERLALEVALLAERVDVSEELARLDIHLAQFRATLKGHLDGIGRKLDFMTQEIGRELNTVASKAQDARVQGFVVDAKVALERIREQVQNVE